MNIGGNIEGMIKCLTFQKNSIGENEEKYVCVQSVFGWLDMITGDTDHRTFNAKIEKSSHVFLMDYVELDPAINDENSIMIINGKRYEITYIDDPMFMHEQIEIYLNYVGGQNV